MANAQGGWGLLRLIVARVSPESMGNEITRDRMPILERGESVVAAVVCCFLLRVE